MESYVATKRLSYDPYSATGTKFRGSTSGMQVSKHTQGINLDHLPANFKRAIETKSSQHNDAIRGKEQTKNPWDRSTRYYDKNGPSPKLTANPYATVSYQEFHSTQKKTLKKKTVFSYTQPPYPIICPEPVLWELSRKKDKELARTRRVQETARLDDDAAEPAHLGTMQEEAEPRSGSGGAAGGEGGTGGESPSNLQTLRQNELEAFPGAD
jgi:hypothetical protein